MPKVDKSHEAPKLVRDRDGIRIYLGDCRALLPTLSDNSIDFAFTDPPYGHNNNNGDLIHNREKALGKERKPHADLISVWERALGKGPPGEARPIHNDGAEADVLVQYIFKEFRRLLKPGSCCGCCCGGGGPDPQFARWSLWLSETVGFKQMIVWDKGPMGMGWHYRRSYETVLVGEKSGAACKWYDESKRIENIIRPGTYGIRKIIPDMTQHSTEKPIELAKHFLRLHTKRGDLVLDPFLGSGSTALACFEMGRRFIGIDLDKENVEMTVDRLENLEGGEVLSQLRKMKRLPGRTKR